MPLIAECSAGSGHDVVLDLRGLDGVHHHPIDRLVGALAPQLFARLDAADLHHARDRLQLVQGALDAMAGGVGRSEHKDSGEGDGK